MATGTASRRSRRWPQWQTPRSAGGQQTCVARDAGRAVAAAAGGKQLRPLAPSPQVCSRLVFLGPVDQLGQLAQLGRRGQLASRRTGVDPHRREIGCALARCWGSTYRALRERAPDPFALARQRCACRALGGAGETGGRTIGSCTGSGVRAVRAAHAKLHTTTECGASGQPRTQLAEQSRHPGAMVSSFRRP
jgi:hypothetical protein